MKDGSQPIAPLPGRPAARRPARSRSRVDRSLELKALRRRLADAWWHEEPLETIESIERAINQCLTELRRNRPAST